MNCNGYEKLLYITSKQSVFIQRHAKEKEKEFKPREVVEILVLPAVINARAHSVFTQAYSIGGNTDCMLAIDIGRHTLVLVKKLIVLQRTNK